MNLSGLHTNGHTADFVLTFWVERVNKVGRSKEGKNGADARRAQLSIYEQQYIRAAVYTGQYI